ncbi:MAG: hypothetical protein Q9163_005199 [Psora crenata]
MPMSSGASTKDTISADGDALARLAQLDAQATLKYSIKDYNAAAELYSQATELQAEINGEMSPQNADLLYAYGRCLYHVAVKNSDVLGSKVAGEKSTEGPKKTLGKEQAALTEPTYEEATRSVDGEVSKFSQSKGQSVKPKERDGTDSKPLFQFTGDENFDTSDEEADGEEQDGEDGDGNEEDDFANAYEVLDLARVLLLEKLREDEAHCVKGKYKVESAELGQIQERLADTYDLQAEISLEGEKFSDAVADLRSALSLKKNLFQPDSSLIAEAHYKLSLALEFCSVTQQQGRGGGMEDGKHPLENTALREEAAKEMEAAIASCKLRIQREEAKLQAIQGRDTDNALSNISTKDIDDVKEMVMDMEQRLSELRQPPVSINDPRSAQIIDGSGAVAGILDSILGNSAKAQNTRLEEASERANDLTTLVKRQKRTVDGPPKAPSVGAPQAIEKRKLDAVEGESVLGNGKRTKVVDSAEQ